MPNCFTLPCELSGDWDPGYKRIRYKNSVLVINATTKGAKPDVLTANDGVISSGNLSQISSTSISFTATDQGKLIAIHGAGASGVTLVTTISSVTGTAANLDTAASSAVSGATFWFGTNNSAIVNQALGEAAALSPGGGIVVLDNGRYAFSDAIDFSEMNGVALRGSGVATNDGPTGTELLLFRASTGNLVEGTAVTGVTISNLTMHSLGTGWTAAIVKPALTSAGSSLWHFENCFFEAENTTTSKLIDLTNCHAASIRNCTFKGGGVQIIGGGESHMIEICSCFFSGYGSVPIKDAVHSWSVISCGFEKGASNQAAAMECVTDAFGLSVVGCWTAASNTSTASGQVWFVLRGYGVVFTGNVVKTGVDGVTGVKFTSNCTGVSVKANHFAMNGSGWTTAVAIDLGSYTLHGLDCFGNSIDAPVKFQNASAAGGGTGLVSMPGARVWKNSGESIAVSSPTKITFNTSTGAGCFNRGVVWLSTDGSKLTVPSGAAGLWMITGQIGWPSGGGGTFRTILIKKNNSDWIARFQDAASSTIALVQNISCTDVAADGDYYEIFAFHDGTAAISTLSSDSGMTFGAAIKLA